MGPSPTSGASFPGITGLRDLAIVVVNACQQIGELVGEGGIELSQFSSELVALGLCLFVCRAAPRVLLGRAQLLKPLLQARQRGRQVVAGDVNQVAARFSLITRAR
jgi:hypothetical protein